MIRDYLRISYIAHKRHDCHCSAQNPGTKSDSSVDRHENFRRPREEDSLVINPVNDRLQEVLAYRTYLPADKLSHYDDRAARSVANWAKRFQVQMRSQTFDSSDPISIIYFLSTYKLACNRSRVIEGASF